MSNHTPLIFSKEIYAFACLFGAISFLGFNAFLTEDIAMSLSILTVIIIRIVSIKKRWHLPFMS